VDPNALPLKGVVAEIRDDGDHYRVTFTRLAGIYSLSKETPNLSTLLLGLKASMSSHSEIKLRYRYPQKTLVGLDESN
jgi:hypothetical protein